MLLAAAYAVGQLVGVLILLVVAVGIARTMLRSDLSLREKVLGKSDQPTEDNAARALKEQQGRG